MPESPQPVEPKVRDDTSLPAIGRSVESGALRVIPAGWRSAPTRSESGRRAGRTPASHTGRYRSARRHAAVDRDGGAGDEGGVIAREEGDELGDFGRLADAAERVDALRERLDRERSHAAVAEGVGHG